MTKKFLITLLGLVLTHSLATASNLDQCGFITSTTIDEFQKNLASVQTKDLACLKESQDANDMMILSHITREGLLDENKNDTRADELLLAAAQADNTLAQHYYAAQLISKGDILGSMAWNEKAANAGLSSAQNSLGMTYLALGQSDKGIAMLELASKNHDVTATKNLAIFYYQGILIKKDFNKSAKLFLQTAQLKDSSAQMTVGGFYTGKVFDFIKEDPNLVFEWTKKAFDQGDINSASNLAEFYRIGYGTEINLSKALELMTLASEKDDLFGIFNLGTYYEYGIAVPIDHAKALSLYQKITAMMPIENTKQCNDLDCHKQLAATLLQSFQRSNVVNHHMINL
ncbi:MAG: tetratricopeptide repeat protein [Wohlfahrtiimonas sp.]